jgi:hypothetical protein
MDKTTANKILTALDHTADEIENLVKTKKIDPKVASQVIKNIDSFADKFEVTAFGAKNLASRKAKVLQQDSDEPYMKTFENTVKPLKTDADEEFMHKVGPSFNSKGIGTYDVDPTSTVSGRDEYAVRDLSEWSDATKKQPSWERGPAGKSTRQG